MIEIEKGGIGVFEQAVGFCKSFAKSDQFYFSSLGFQIEYLTIFTFIVKGLVVKQVQFYLLNQPNSELNLACELAANAWRLGKRVLIACETEQQAFKVDELLWARDPNAFVPHNLSGEVTQYPTPIEITWADKRNAQRRDVLISLQHHIPNFAQSFTQVIDFVPTEEEQKTLARERYKQYRAAGWQLSTQPA